MSGTPDLSGAPHHVEMQVFYSLLRSLRRNRHIRATMSQRRHWAYIESKRAAEAASKRQSQVTTREEDT